MASSHDGRRASAHPRLSRRDFLGLCGRLAAGGALGFLGFKLLQKSTTLPASCVNDFYCRGCGALNGCVFPQALSFKNRRGPGSGPARKAN